MKQILVAVFGLVLLGMGSVRAQENSPPEGYSTNCTVATGAPFLILVSEPANGWPYVCVGEPVSVTAVITTNLAGLEDITQTNQDGYVFDTIIPLPTNSITSDCWQATNTPFFASSNGLTATFTPTNCGNGELTFSITYQEAAICGSITTNVSMTTNFTVVSVASLGPIIPTNFTLLTSNTTLQTFAIPVSTDPTVTNLEVFATSCPSLPAADLPACWSLDGLQTNAVYLGITNSAVYDVVCTAGTSSIENVIWVTTSNTYNPDTNGLVFLDVYTPLR